MSSNPENRQKHSGFKSVDSSEGDPGWYVRYLERISSLPPIKRYIEASYGLLNLHPDDYVLDAGCGIGIDPRRIANTYGFVGKVVGLDSSSTMLENARALTLPDVLKLGKVEFVLGDLSHLPFSNDVFDACRSDRTFQYFEDPQNYLEEIIRVAKLGGRIVITEPNWESLSIGLSKENKHVAKTTFLNIIPNPRIGRELKGLFLRTGLKNVNVFKMPIPLKGAGQVQDVLSLESSLNRAVVNGAISEKQAAECLAEFQSCDPEKIKASFDIYVVQGKKH